MTSRSTMKQAVSAVAVECARHTALETKRDYVYRISRSSPCLALRIFEA